MKGGKRTYAELLREINMLEFRNKELHQAMKAANRTMVGYGVDRWVSLPLPYQQETAIREMIEEITARQHGAGKLLSEVDGEQSWETIVHSDDFRGGRPLAEYAAYFIKYTFTQDEGIHVDKIYALIPV